MEISRLLPSRDDLATVRVPPALNHTFSDALRIEMQRSKPVTSGKFDPMNVANIESFFASITEPRAAVTHPVKKNTTLRRSLDNLSSSSKRQSLLTEEFPVELLKEDADRINNVTNKIHQQMHGINGIEDEKRTFQRMIEELQEAVNRWQEKTQILTEKAKDQPNYLEADHLLSRDTRENLEQAEQLLRSLRARKQMEIQLGETLPDPTATVDSMSYIRTLVGEFISDDKHNF